MGNLFSDLFKYKQTEGSTPLENFSTELLKHVLENHKDVLRLFLPDKYIAGDLDLIDVHTQYYLDGLGIADLFLTDNDSLSVIIENKIDAAFQEKQISRYKEYIASSEYNSVVALIIQEYEFEKLGIGKPDKIIYWNQFIDELERMQSDKHDVMIKEFIKFTRENNMSYDKVKWPLLDGLKEKDNFLKMLNGVLGKCSIKYPEFGRPKNYKDSHSADYNSLSYTYKDLTVAISFFHSSGILYFLIYDPQKKFDDKTFRRLNAWGSMHAIIGEFDLSSEPFFHLDKVHQENTLYTFFETCILTLQESR